ncbi:MAG: KilA-N domain-containing protein [Lentisphaerae bacterium]|nr:KilA-N domain-containing protein [Lentisphaerota bacterium]
MKKKNEINVQDQVIRLMKHDGRDYVCITDIAKQKNPEFPADVIKNWMRSKNTVAFLGLWEQLNNPAFKLVEFDQFKSEAGLNSFVLPPQTWIEKTGAIGLISKSGRYGGTYAQSDIAFEFASWVSVEFKLYLVTEFQRLKSDEQKLLGWSVKRELTKLNYRIHTDAIKENLIPAELTAKQTAIVYASEADVLNMALFGMTAREWSIAHPDLKGNMRDYADIAQLICLANLESLNAVLIEEKLPQQQRLERLNQVAIKQMRILTEEKSSKLLGGK